MSVSTEQTQALTDLFDLVAAAGMCGASSDGVKGLIERAVKEFVFDAFNPPIKNQSCNDGRKSTIDWSKATPRPDEKTWFRLRATVLQRDGYVCAYCKTSVGPLTADHVVPLSRGGTNDLSNLTACCLPCNSSKRHYLLSEWKGRSTCQ